MSGRLPEDRILDFVCNAEPAQWLKALQHAFTPPPSDEHALQSHIPEGACAIRAATVVIPVWTRRVMRLTEASALPCARSG